MSDPLRTDSAREPQHATESDREAKIEQLLLDGLDQYFAARYEQAINIWTRALFFDRNHPRARAYIERARSALAERQRESEELLQSGVAAFHRGDGGEARRLIEAAIVRGAPSDEALAVLDRLSRLEQGQHPTALAAGDSSEAIRVGPVERRADTRRLVLAAAGGFILVIAAAGFTVLRGLTDWRAPADGRTTSAASTNTPPIADTPLPLPRRAAITLERARALVLSGRLRDALEVLDQIGPTDHERADADRLRAEIQRQLLSVAQASDGADQAGGGRPAPSNRP
jgi:tetratricopeptide (TPR) repeat protein